MGVVTVSKDILGSITVSFHYALSLSKRSIQELLGHASSKTTEIYTHVSTRSLGKIRSPLDNLELEGGEKDKD